MSLATLLLAFVAPIVRPNPAPEKSARERELEGQVEALRTELEAAWAERASLRRRLDEADVMLARLAGERIGERLSLPSGLQQQQMAQYAAQQQLAMISQLNALNAPLAQQADYQNLQNPLYCHCVPGRHEALLGAIGGA